MVAAVELVVACGGLRSTDEVVFLCGIYGFFALGVGQLNCLFMLGLSQPRPALTAALAGTTASTMTGIPLAFVDFRLAALAFAAGAAVFAVTAGASCRGVIQQADHHYANAF
jgi:hypothetical protein